MGPNGAVLELRKKDPSSHFWAPSFEVPFREELNSFWGSCHRRGHDDCSRWARVDDSVVGTRW